MGACFSSVVIAAEISTKHGFASSFSDKPGGRRVTYLRIGLNSAAPKLFPGSTRGQDVRPWDHLCTQSSLKVEGQEPGHMLCWPIRSAIIPEPDPQPRSK